MIRHIARAFGRETIETPDGERNAFVLQGLDERGDFVQLVVPALQLDALARSAQQWSKASLQDQLSGIEWVEMPAQARGAVLSPAWAFAQRCLPRPERYGYRPLAQSALDGAGVLA